MNGYKITGSAPLRAGVAALAALSRALCAPSPEPDQASVSAGLTPEGGRIVVEAKGMPAPAPLFFSASVEETVRLGTAAVAGEMRLRLHVLQGRPEVLTLGLSGDGEVTDVAGPASAPGPCGGPPGLRAPGGSSISSPRAKLPGPGTSSLSCGRDSRNRPCRERPPSWSPRRARRPGSRPRSSFAPTRTSTCAWRPRPGSLRSGASRRRPARRGSCRPVTAGSR
jgi:hypothetical protein